MLNLKTRSTGTIHAANAEGAPLCPARVAATGLESTSEPVSCRSCLKLHSLEVVERQEQPAVEQPASAEIGVRGTVRVAEGIVSRVYPGENVAELLDTLKSVQKRGGLPVDAEVVARTPGGVWEPLGAAPVPVVSLSAEQLDGVACIRCHATDEPMIPAGTGERGQLFECDSHTAAAAEDCPAWCTTDHTGGEVEHASDLKHVDEHTEFMTGFRQDPGGPVLIVLCDDERSDGTLTLEQAEHLATHLQALITVARQGARSS